MLEIQAVTKTFGGTVHAVNDVTLSLNKGVVGLIGHNGAGKTTLMQMIATLMKPTLGRILLDGVDIGTQPDTMRRQLGFLPQDFGVYPHLTAREFLQYFAALKGVRDASRIPQLLEQVNLRDHADRLAATFSGGMRQRLGIAQALLNDPTVLIVDEPTAGLDPEERLRFRHLLSEIGFDKLVIVSTHIVSDIESMAGEIAVMRDGRLIAHQTPDEILAEALGHIWELRIEAANYESFAAAHRVLHVQRQGSQMNVRVVSEVAPIAGALPAQPTLEEALMTARYLAQNGRPSPQQSRLDRAAQSPSSPPPATGLQ